MIVWCMIVRYLSFLKRVRMRGFRLAYVICFYGIVSRRAEGFNDDPHLLTV